VGELASELAGRGTPGSAVPTQDPAFYNQVKNIACE
jgi:hypothetical protein